MCHYGRRFILQNILTWLINRIADYVIPKDNPLGERIGDVMGGQILKLRSEKLREEGREEKKVGRLKYILWFRMGIRPRNVRQGG